MLHVSTQGVAPPVLLVVNSASPNPYGPYLAEILKAEGVSSFSVAQLSTVTQTTLNNAQVVVLAETPLSASQALLFSNYVDAGGRLIAMRPDAQLLPALGLSVEASATSEGYFAIAQGNSFADGFPSTTLPFHGQARHYTPANGSLILATLFSNATTATTFPAVVRHLNTVTWSYDLPTSIVYTRQGNPANASDRDGQPPYRTTDLFYNAIDRDKVPIPYADVQMRMLARTISDLLADVMPLPRMWYFPGTNRTVVVLTGDSHANPQSYFDTEINTVESYGGRISLYAYGGTSPSASSRTLWRSRGHEIGMHPAGYQTGNSLTSAFQNNLNWFTGLYGSNPSATTRIHQVEWQGWVDAAKVAANFGIGLDTSFYTWGPPVTYPDGHQAHGYINGSGQPMRFIDQSGTIVPVYQQVTSLIDEALVTTDFSEHLSPAAATAVSQQIIDNSQAGDYAAVTTQFHVDYFAFGDVNTWATGTMNYARSLGIPMWTAERWLNYASARQATTITNLSWSVSTGELFFSVGVPTGSEAQSLALPQQFGGYGLTSVTVDGASATGVQQQISGRPTVFLNIASGSHALVALYNTPLPTASVSVQPTVITQGQTSNLSWTTANATSITIDQGIGSVGPNGTRSVNPLVTTTYNITATNSAGSATAATTLTVIPPPPTVTASMSPTTIAAGDPATLSWSTTNAGTVTIDQGIGTVGASGAKVVSPPSTTTYTVTVTNVTGSASATATVTVNPAPAGSSLRFNGTSQRARFTTLPAQTVFTVEGWMKRTADTGRWETFFSNVNGGYSLASVNMYVDGGNNDCGSSPSDQFAWAYTQVGGGWFIQCSGVTANLNAWHHIAVTRDSSNVARIFIDGVLRATANATATPTTTGVGAFGLGDAGDAGDEYFPGLLDEVRISSVARYSSNFTPQTARLATDANTVALYHLDEGTGQNLADASGNNRSGFLGTTASTESIDPTWSTDVPFTPPVSAAPVITTQPNNQTVASGGNASFAVGASGTPTPTYQWQVSVAGGAFTNLTNSAPYSGVTTTTLTITSASAGLSGNQYRAVATNTAGSATSNAALLTVTVAPTITTQPTNQTVVAGQNGSFTAAASGTPAPALQWQVSTNGGTTFTNLANGAPYSGVTTSVLTLTAVTTGLNNNQYRLVATNSAGTATSSAALLTVTVAPTITTQPSNQTVTSGGNASFTVAASGSPTPTYQWQISVSGGAFTNLTNSAPYSGATTTTLTITGAATGLSGNQYRAVATNSAGSATSSAALLTVNAAPTITTQPSNQTVTAGGNTSFTVAASGTPTPAYQWQVSAGGGTFTNLANGAPYGGVTTTTLTINAATAGLSGNQYRAIATNSEGSATSSAALLTVNVAPTITTQPTDQTIVAGDDGSFSAAATGTPAPTLQWQVSSNGGVTFTDLVNGAPYSGVTTNVLTLTAATTGLSDNQYRLVATNSAGTATSTAATLTVSAAASAPVITTDPSNQTVTSGANASFTVAASGSPTPTYQWQVSAGGGAFTNLTNSAPYSGVTTTTLTITAATAGLSGNQYRAVATNSAGSATSTAALLTVDVAPTITTQPINQTVTAGGNASFTVAASGSPTPTYQWQVSAGGGAFTNLAESGSYSGVTTTTLTITAATTGLSGNQYRAIATNSAGSATSSSALLTVNVAPAITTEPSNQTVTSGANASFTVAASGTPTPTYQWQVSASGGAFTNLTNSAPYSGVTTTTLTITAATAGLSGNQYRAVATNGEGSAISSAALLTVNVAPTITTQPINQTVTAGANASFSVAASGSPAPTYQWQVSAGGGAFTNLAESGPYSGVTTTTLTITAATSGLSGNQYRAIATNSAGSATSSAALLTVNVAPTVTTQPTNQTVTAGANALFTVAASGTPTPTYQWQVSIGGGAFTNLTNGAPYSGVATTTLTITAATSGLSGNQYRAVATNSEGSATSSAALLTVNVAPTITTQPANQTVTAGGNASFTVAASGSPTPTYQWQVSAGGGAFTNLTNSGPYSGVTATTLTITGATTGLSGNQYRAIATNSAGSATSSAALLTVNVAPTVTAQPTNQTATAGANALFTVAASGTPTPTYQWQVSASGGAFTNLTNSAPYSGVTTTTLTITGVTTGLSGNQYRAVATNSVGTATSSAATLTVNAPPPGASLAFNGTNRRARFTTLPAMTVFTVEGWVKRTSDTGRYETFLSNASNGYSQETVGIYIDGGNADCGSSPSDQFAWAYTKTSGGRWFFQCSGVTASLNVWYHIAVTRDSANVTRIFVNGVLRNTMTGTAAPTTSTGTFGMGTAGDAATEFFPGLLDEVRISSVARYSGTFTPQTTPFATDASTIALYHLDEGTGQVLADSSGNNRNGVLGTSSAVETADAQWSTDAPVH